MSAEEDFDAFYRTTRDETVLQVFCHTGDLTAAQSATKDAYEIAWQHWRKVLRTTAPAGGDPLSYVRPLAYRLGTRRHVGRVWHRRRGLTTEHRETLDALHRLHSPERRLLLLTELGGLQPGEAAREIGLSRGDAAARLERARARMARALGEGYAARLHDLAEPVARARLPRPTVVMRSGRKRRRLTAVGALAGALVVTVGGGAMAREPGLDRSSSLHQLVPGGEPVGLELPEDIHLTKPAQLLGPGQLSGLAPDQTWRVVRTDANTGGDGLNAICQRSRFADPSGISALVRTFDTGGVAAHSALQSVEISRNQANAQAAYARAVGWFSGCQLPGYQFQSAYELQGVGDQAVLMQVKVSGGTGVSNYDVAVTRLGEILTTLVVRSPGDTRPSADAIAAVVTDAVGKLCPTGSKGSCVDGPKVVAVPPPPSTEEAGFVATVDLPTVAGVRDPWVGVKSQQTPTGPDTTTRCDQADFVAAGADPTRSRTYLIPQTDLAATFGFTETYAVFENEAEAAAYLATLRDRVNGCAETVLTIKVGKEQRETVAGGTSGYDMSDWRLENKVDNKQTVVFRIGLVQVGNAIAKLTFVPDGAADMTDADFQWLTRRAGERLRELK